MLDVRIMDLRQAAVTLDRPTTARLLNVERANVFVITPPTLSIRRASPELRYIRLLEGRAWEKYLGRRTDIRRQGKLTVSYWRRDHVARDSEFRGWIDIVSERRPIHWTQVAATAVLALIAAYLVLPLNTWRDQYETTVTVRPPHGSAGDRFQRKYDVLYHATSRRGISELAHWAIIAGDWLGVSIIRWGLLALFVVSAMYSIARRTRPARDVYTGSRRVLLAVERILYHGSVPDALVAERT